MNYQVVDENGIYNQEFDFYLEPGFEFADGELEPDLIANYLALGRIITEEDNKSTIRRKRTKSKE